MEHEAICGKCGTKIPFGVDLGHSCLKQLKGGRQISITVTTIGYTVQQGAHYVDGLAWDEMLGQIVELTHPDLHRPPHYRMMTAQEWRKDEEDEDRRRSTEPVIDWDFKEVGE